MVKPLFQKNTFLVCLLILIFGVLTFPSNGQIYVDVSVSPGGDGSSWATAYDDLQQALTTASSGDSIFVAEGTYYPVSPSDPGNVTIMEKEISFVIPDSVRVYGGFPAGGDVFANRDWEVNETILSGDIGVQNDSIDNSYHVVYTKNVSDATLVDGFTITDGNADGSLPYFGGGWYNEGSGSGNLSNPRIENCVFSSNSAVHGGAIYNYGVNGGESSPELVNCVFTSNTAERDGGAIYNSVFFDEVCSPKLVNCVFTSNIAGRDGGAIYNFSNIGESSPVLVNCVFESNSARDGGAIYNSGLFGESSPTLKNSIFYNNSAEREGSIFYNDEASVSISYSLFDESYNVVNHNSDVTDDGYNLFSTDPLFIDAVNGDFHLQPISPAIDSGDPTTPIIDFYKVNGMAVDLDLNSRVEDDIDIGVYEFSCSNYSFTEGIIYVDLSATGGNDGTSWTDAFTDLQSALQLFKVCPNAADSIFVAEGTYYPTSTGNRTVSFMIPDSVRVYGGFPAGGGGFVNRDWDANKTILSGDIGVQNDSTDNSCHVVYTKNVSDVTLVDGFTITDGNADGSFANYRGGGWYNDGSGLGNVSSPRIENCVFESNSAKFGGAIYNSGNEGVSSPKLVNCVFTSNTVESIGGAILNDGTEGVSTPKLVNCVFTSNTAGSDGGAIYNSGREGVSSPKLVNCVFTSNTAGSDGGAIYNSGNEGVSSPELVNCVFTSNTAESDGGAINNDGEFGESSPELVNCVFESNSADQGGAIYSVGIGGESSPILKNSIFYENTAQNEGPVFYTDNGSVSISYCLFDLAFFDVNNTFNVSDDGNNLFSTHPLFVDAANGDFHLQLTSPAINRGDPSTSTMGFYQVNGMAVDLDLNPRIENTIDMGVFEINCGSHSFPDDIIYVDLTATSGGDNGTSWNDAFTDLQSALGILNACPDAADKIYVAEGTYKPTGTTNREISFNIPTDVEVYGGFPSGGDIFANRDWEIYETILSGDIGVQNDSTDNSYHVVSTLNVSDSTLVEGFIITNGNADGSNLHGYGGGWLNIANSDHSNPRLNKCHFYLNHALIRGGGMYNQALDVFQCSPTISNTLFEKNISKYGGAVNNTTTNGGMSQPLIEHC
ncbi:hypothetical protein GCM10025777_11310 [Membranihabitans marinus]